MHKSDHENVESLQYLPISLKGDVWSKLVTTAVWLMERRAHPTLRWTSWRRGCHQEVLFLLLIGEGSFI